MSQLHKSEQDDCSQDALIEEHDIHGDGGQPVTSQFLLCEIRVQQMLADVYKALSDAAGLDMEMPGVS